ncbi:hypothetical protein EVAR_802_1 [Eumeta japonica]|uniref:Ig-like domain-containing protein n=1 Tax=Eumeta variegata TaxID=151549 RepID=A0A4C1SEW4_EUMVA|nr:hypothetical protein EVAR_802_1 [Eumeta japonica]
MRPWALGALVLVFFQVTTTSSSRTVETLDPVRIDVENADGDVDVTIEGILTRLNEGCEIETPSGSVYELTDDLPLAGVRAMTTTLAISCGVTITATADVLGEWWLIANETDFTNGASVQRRLRIIVHEGAIIIQLRKCEIVTPDGGRHELTNYTNINGIRSIQTNLAVSCGIAVQVSENVLGEWMLIAKETNWLNGLTVDTKLPIIFQKGYSNETASTEEPPSTDVNKLENKVINTEIGETFEVTITRGFDHETELCQIVKPDGSWYDFGTVIPGVTEQSTHESCSVTVTVLSEEFVGQWMLIAKEHKMLSGTYIETRLPFEVVVERSVQAIPQNSATVQENSNFHIRLMEPTDMYQTCRLVAPNAQALNRVQLDQSATNSCAYIVNKVTEEDNGKWAIVYGNNILYKASVELTVTDSTYPAIDTQVISLTQNTAVNMEVGPEGAVYCRLEDPYGVVVFDGFGRCILNIPRVPSSYNGHWTMTVEPRPGVQMSLAMSHADLALSLSCSVETSSTPRACKFRDPQGRILVAQEGVGEDRYSFHGAGISSASGKYTMDCGLRITSPGVEDLGIWRCGVDTEDDTRYGFLLVVCPWLMRNETIAATVETEPVLRPRVPYISTTPGDSVEMSCTIPSGIRYCYFRSQNGTILTATPGVSNDVFEYVGSGLEAGECGIRLRDFSMNDIGQWSCNVGTNNGSLPEKSAHINVYGSGTCCVPLGYRRDANATQLASIPNSTLKVETLLSLGQDVVLKLSADSTCNYSEEQMSASLRLQSDHSAILNAYVGIADQIDYCRFIRSDGFGFTNELVPEGYVFRGPLSARQCDLRIVRPRNVDFLPWIVAARITGQESEIIARTPPLEVFISQGNSSFFVFRLTLLCICIGLLCLSLGLMFSSKKSRRWTYARAAAVRDSIRRSFRKSPPLEAKPAISSPQAA